MAGGENTSGLFLCPVLGGRYALGGVHSKISMTPFKFTDYQEFERRKDMTRVFIWKNNSPQEWEEISFSAFSKARRNGCFTGRFFIETTENVDGHNERVITECSQARYKTHRQELGTINQDVVHTNSPQRHDTYVYYFADGSRSTLVLGADDTSCVNGAWIAELRELDRLEYNNQHTQTRRHCSLDAQDPEGMGGYYTGDDMERVQLELEVEDFLTSLPKDLEQIARLLCEGFLPQKLLVSKGSIGLQYAEN